MKKILVLLAVLVVSLPLMGAGCITVKTTDNNPPNGGIFISWDKGEVWQQKNYIRTVGKHTDTISTVNIMEMFFDPQDSQTVYIATEKDGVYVTYNGGEQWDVLYARTPRVYEISVDPTNRYTIYMSLGREIVKSVDGGKTWDQIYFEALDGVIVETISIDAEDTDLVYIGTTDGRFIRSVDAGETWGRVADFQSSIKQVLVNPNDGRIIYLATDIYGVYRSDDSGQTWHNISLGDDFNQGSKTTQRPTAGKNSGDQRRIKYDPDTLPGKYPGIENFKIMVFDQTQDDAIIIGTEYGLLKNQDGDEDWEAVRLLTMPAEIEVVSLAVNPQNNQEIYYGINNALYFSQDGGKNWAARSLPTTRMAQYLLVDPDEPSKVWLGVYLPPPPDDDNGGFFL